MPYRRLSSFYFFYFAALGALVPFWGLYLQHRGFSVLAIGQLMAIFMATKILAPNLWGWIADHTGRRLPLVRLASLLAAVIFLGIFLVEGFWSTALVMSLFSFFWNAALPQMEAVTFNFLGTRARRYARIRLWGSIGFILAVLLLGRIVEDAGTALVPWLVLVLYVGIWLSSLTIPECPACTSPDRYPVPFLALLRRPEIWAFLLSAFFMQASHGAYYAFYSIYLTSAGYASGTVGALWAWGVLAEVLVFLVAHRLLERFGARRILLASLALAILRWLVTGAFVTSPAMQLAAQTLHAATFGTFHVAAIFLVHQYFTGRAQCRGQALYNSLGFGAGGAFGSLVSGFLWDEAGALATFGFSAGVASLGWLAVWWRVDRERPR